MIVRITSSAARVKTSSLDGRWRMADGGWRMADGGWRMADGRDLPRAGGAICCPPSAICLKIRVRNMIECLARRFALHVDDAGLQAGVGIGLCRNGLGAARFAVLERVVHDQLPVGLPRY